MHITNLDAMVILVDDDETTSDVDGDSSRAIKLARAITVASKFPDERAVVAINLYAIIGSIADYDVTVVVAGQSPRAAKIVGVVLAKVTDDLDIRALD